MTWGARHLPPAFGISDIDLLRLYCDQANARLQEAEATGWKPDPDRWKRRCDSPGLAAMYSQFDSEGT